MGEGEGSQGFGVGEGSGAGLELTFSRENPGGNGGAAPTVPWVLVCALPGVPPSTLWYLPYLGQATGAFRPLSWGWQN